MHVRTPWDFSIKSLQKFHLTTSAAGRWAAVCQVYTAKSKKTVPQGPAETGRNFPRVIEASGGAIGGYGLLFFFAFVRAAPGSVAIDAFHARDALLRSNRLRKRLI
jgi:hypothetical protein